MIKTIINKFGCNFVSLKDCPRHHKIYFQPQREIESLSSLSAPYCTTLSDFLPPSVVFQHQERQSNKIGADQRNIWIGTGHSFANFQNLLEKTLCPKGIIHFFPTPPIIKVKRERRRKNG